MNAQNLLIVADSEHDANMLYAVGMFIPDPFVYFRIRGKCHLLLSDLEIDRARRRVGHCHVLSLGLYQQKASNGKRRASLSKVIAYVLRQNRLKKIFVPANFPLGLARELREQEIKVKVKPGAFFSERERKTSDEVKKLSAALMMAEVGLAEGIQTLKRSKITRAGRLLYNNVALTSEKLRSIIDVAIIQAGGTVSHTIVAGGKQACDPHEPGHGPLKAHQPIILDVFPRSQKTGYFGDISRTVVRGKASEPVRKLYTTVWQAQELALQQIKASVPAARIHQTVAGFFDKQGYRTGKGKGRMQGFFHGTGHGLGLEIHEAPRIGNSSLDTLQDGHVVTVEPGLYYPEIGGVRLEDVVHVTAKGNRNLTKFEKVLEI